MESIKEAVVKLERRKEVKKIKRRLDLDHAARHALALARRDVARVCLTRLKKYNS